jgi:mRNA interferase MazF
VAGGMTRRGQFVTVALSGDYGKPRPALVVQADLFSDLASVVICPVTTTVRPEMGRLRIAVIPAPANGLRKVSQISIDKIVTVRADKIGPAFGVADEELMNQVSRALALLLNIV